MGLPELAPALIVVSRDDFTMKLVRYRIVTSPSALGPQYKINVTTQTFPIAVGARGHATKRGEYRVVNKSTEPDWLAPNSEWVPEEMRGQKFPFEDQRNPFAGGFISFEDDDPDNDNEGMGFHGVKFDHQLGTRASHGCVRMDTDDFKSIYDKVPIGSLVVIF